MEALALWRLGRAREAYALLEAASAGDAEADAQLRGMRGWLRFADDDLLGAKADLAAAIELELRLGALNIGAIHLTVLSRAHYARGEWDEAVAVAARAPSVATELAAAPGRSFVWWAAVAVPAARGDWAAAAPFLEGAAREPVDAPDRLVAIGMARALVACARGDAAGVIAALADVERIAPRDSVDAPGFWPWQDLYAEALVSAGRPRDADAFLRAQEALAEKRGSASMIAKLARARGRLEASVRHADAARQAYERALMTIVPLAMPYETAQIQLGFGQFLRRERHRRAALAQLGAARETFATLGARPALELCERELEACGLRPARRGEAGRLTSQEQTIARLAATGRTNREMAAELLVSPKTIEAHLTRIYAKLGLTSRAQLATFVVDSNE
jgi:DNA-binding CsgD family transcriptional regulator/tetratricopeptide (TPR) repeat protein